MNRWHSVRRAAPALACLAAAASVGWTPLPAQEIHRSADRGPPATVPLLGASDESPHAGEELPPKSPAQIARERLPAVVEVATYGDDDRRLTGGSGFLVGPEGLVVTSHHVLEGARRAEVLLHDGELFEVEHVAAAAARHDLVILRIAGFRLPVVELGDSRRMEVGDVVVVIGSPLGLTNTVTHGLLSAKREMEGRRLLQLSAPISSGSSGGPVFDVRGRVVGVLAGFYRKGQNVNFAVPIERVRGLLDLPSRFLTVESVGRRRVQLLGGENSSHPWLSLDAVLRGEPVPGQERTPWALQRRRLDPERVRAERVGSPEELVGAWELRELSRVPRTRSGMYRGVLAPDRGSLAGSFFGSLVSDPGFDAEFQGERIRDFRLELGAEGRATLYGEHGCSYFVHAAADAMSGVYECTDREGGVYDLGAVELRRVTGAGPTGVYDVAEEIPLGRGVREGRGRMVVYALEDGRWLGAVASRDRPEARLLHLRAGRWTRDGELSARLRQEEGRRVRGSFGEERLELVYPLGGGDYPVRVHLRAIRRLPPPAGMGTR